jgi:hypothetical protein
MRVDLRRDLARKKMLDPRVKIAHMAGMTQALEEQIAHLTRTVEELSDVVAKQDAELRPPRRGLSIFWPSARGIVRPMAAVASFLGMNAHLIIEPQVHGGCL